MEHLTIFDKNFTVVGGGVVGLVINLLSQNNLQDGVGKVWMQGP